MRCSPRDVRPDRSWWYISAQSATDNYARCTVRTSSVAVDFRPPVVRELPDNPLSIFHLLVPESLVEEWVVATNLAAESHISLPDTPKPWSRLQRWRPTILISMENHEETAVQDYWKSSIMDSVHPFYPWTRYMDPKPLRAIMEVHSRSTMVSLSLKVQ